MKKPKLKISIITVTYNSETYLSSCLASVAAQTYSNKEHIIIDGLSKDKTPNLIEAYAKQADYPVVWISEKDKGIYDAMNKGIERASGDVIGFLNSDDFFASQNILAKIAQTFTARSPHVTYGDLQYVDQNNTQKVIRHWQAGNYRLNSFKIGWHPPHPTFYAKKQLFEQYGHFRLDMPIAADYELMLRFMAPNPQMKAEYLPQVLVKMRTGGVSNRSFSNILKSNQDCVRAFRLNGLSAPFGFIFFKLTRKLWQYFAKK